MSIFCVLITGQLKLSCFLAQNPHRRLEMFSNSCLWTAAIPENAREKKFNFEEIRNCYNILVFYKDYLTQDQVKTKASVYQDQDQEKRKLVLQNIQYTVHR